LETRARARYVRISPRKARAVVDLIRGKSVDEARQILEFSPRAAARVVAKVLASAVANAENNNGLKAEGLYIAKAFVDEGPTLKRFRPRAMGRATRINKRTSHITIVLDESETKKVVKRRGLRRRAGRKQEKAEEIRAEEDRGKDKQSKSGSKE